MNYAGNLTGFSFLEIVIVTHLYDVPQLKLVFVLPDYCLKDLSVALLITSSYIVQFSRYEF